MKTGGNDESGGTTWGTAFKTVTKAVSAATTDGGNIYVAAGEYTSDEIITLTAGIKLLRRFCRQRNYH